MSDTSHTPLRAARDAKDFSRERVTRLLDPPVVAKTLERWENGTTPAPQWRLEQLAQIYGTSPDELKNGKVPA